MIINYCWEVFGLRILPLSSLSSSVPAFKRSQECNFNGGSFTARPWYKWNFTSPPKSGINSSISGRSDLSERTLSGRKKKRGGKEIQFKKECRFHFCSELITCGAADRHLACWWWNLFLFTPPVYTLPLLFFVYLPFCLPLPPRRVIDFGGLLLVLPCLAFFFFFLSSHAHARLGSDVFEPLPYLCILFSGEAFMWHPCSLKPLPE